MPSPRPRNRNGLLSLGLQDGAIGGTGAETGMYVTDNEPHRATYSLFLAGFIPTQANPTDVLQISGSAGKVIRVKSITIAGTATAATNIIIRLIRRSSTSNTTGATSIFGVSRDTTNDSATAAIRTWTTTNPSSLGVQVGNLPIDGGRLNLAPAANGSIDRLMSQYCWQMDQAVVLRSASECLNLNLNGDNWPAGGSLDISIMWTEE